jgi:hypothetical protein
MLGIHWARGFDPFVRAAKGNNPDMTYHGGVYFAVGRERGDLLGIKLV